jgi:hypothetical protein
VILVVEQAAGSSKRATAIRFNFMALIFHEVHAAAFRLK